MEKNEWEKPMQNIAVLGTGTWGTALLRLLANKGHAVTALSLIHI